MTKSVPQFAIIRERSAQTFEEKLNTRLRDLSDSGASVTFGEIGDDLVAQISYVERVEETTVVLPLSETGIKFHCVDCPKFQPVLNRHGEEDGRVKYGNCPNAPMGRVFKKSEACDLLYNLIINGEVRLCLNDSE